MPFQRKLALAAVPPRRVFVFGVSSVGELGQKRLALLVTEATQTTAVSNLQLLHDLGGADLTDARKGLQHGRDLELADNVVLLGTVQNLGQGGLALLELLLELSASLADLRGLLKRSGALLRGQCRERHQFSSVLRSSQRVR